MDLPVAVEPAVHMDLPVAVEAQQPLLLPVVQEFLLIEQFVLILAPKFPVLLGLRFVQVQAVQQEVLFFCHNFDKTYRYLLS